MTSASLGERLHRSSIARCRRRPHRQVHADQVLRAGVLIISLIPDPWAGAECLQNPIVDLRGPEVDAQARLLVERAAMKYVPIPMTTREAPTEAMVAAFLQIVSDPANQPVYVHCVGGRHRTGVMTAVYRMEHDRWTAEQAFREMKQYKFGADFLHPEFKKFVYGYRPHPAVGVKVE